MSARMIEPSIEPTTAYIGLGANLGDVRATLQQAIAALHAPPGRQVLRVSPFYRTAPVEAAGPHYLNAVVELSTSLDADALLAHLQEIENKHGRERPYRNAPRTLDLDLLLFGDVVIDTPMLSVPHPRLHTRAFVLRPLADLAPGLLVPGQGQVEQLLAAVADQRIDADKLSP